MIDGVNTLYQEDLDLQKKHNKDDEQTEQEQKDAEQTEPEKDEKPAE